VRCTIVSARVRTLGFVCGFLRFLGLRIPREVSFDQLLLDGVWISHPGELFRPLAYRTLAHPMITSDRPIRENTRSVRTLDRGIELNSAELNSTPTSHPI